MRPTMRSLSNEPTRDLRPSFRSKAFSVQSLYFAPEYQKRSLTRKEKMRTTLAIGRKPTAKYLLKDHSTAAPMPMVYLRTVRVVLIARTFVRCPSSSTRDTDDGHDVATGEILIAEQDLSDQNLEMEDCIEIGQTYTGFRISPTFNTFNISRRYSLVIYVQVECGKVQKSKDFYKQGLLL
ncbi:MAG: hypothetical protein Q9182_001993 [Xanthomendoza sp. 2 TL-2023]